MLKNNKIKIVAVRLDGCYFYFLQFQFLDMHSIFYMTCGIIILKYVDFKR